MKTMGKIAALAMTLSLAFVLSACGGNAASSAASSASASAAPESAATSAEAAPASESAAADETASPAAEGAAAESAVASTASTETATADEYENEFFGLKYSLPEGWSFSDAAALQSTNSPVANAANSDAIDMVATSADKASSVIVAIMKPGEVTTAKSAQEFLASQVEQMTSSLDGSNFSYTSNGATVTFDGLARELPANVTTVTVEGQTLVIGQAVAEKEGAFLDVLVTGKSEDEVMSAFKSFAATAE